MAMVLHRGLEVEDKRKRRRVAEGNDGHDDVFRRMMSPGIGDLDRVDIL